MKKTYVNEEQKFIDEIEYWIGGNILLGARIDWMSLTRFLRQTYREHFPQPKRRAARKG